jgi:hypothetical protein
MTIGDWRLGIGDWLLGMALASEVHLGMRRR